MSDEDAPLDRRAFLRLLIRRGASAVAAFGLGLLVDDVWARLVRGPRFEREEYRRVVVGRWRVHHNIAGYVLLAAGALTYRIVLVPLGLGMIVGHGLRDRLFWFLERVG
jgi:hypothetical protein